MTELEIAEARIKETRAQLFATIGKVQEKLRPSSLAQDAVESAAHGVATITRRGVEAVRTRPLATAAVAGTIGLVMARGWIGDILGNRRTNGSKSDETGTAQDRSKAKPARSAPRAKKGPTP